MYLITLKQTLLCFTLFPPHTITKSFHYRFKVGFIYYLSLYGCINIHCRTNINSYNYDNRYYAFKYHTFLMHLFYF